MGVIANGAQIPAGGPIHQQRFVAAAKNMAALFMPMIEPVGISAQEPAQSGHQIAFRGFEDQMKMVFHQTKGMNLEAGFLAGLAQGFDEIMAIALIKEDGFATISPAQDMIDRAGVLNAYGTCHPPILPQKTPGGQCKNGQIYGLTPVLFGLTPVWFDPCSLLNMQERANIWFDPCYC